MPFHIFYCFNKRIFALFSLGMAKVQTLRFNYIFDKVQNVSKSISTMYQIKITVLFHQNRRNLNQFFQVIEISCLTKINCSKSFKRDLTMKFKREDWITTMSKNFGKETFPIFPYLRAGCEPVLSNGLIYIFDCQVVGNLLNLQTTDLSCRF